jgi:D-cysteine desulfhydrase
VIPDEPALLRAHPELARVLPRHPIVTGPTPVAALPLAGLPEGALFVKRDERCSPLYGGNKPRKLEWILGEAVGRGARRLITTGGIGTHHGLATAILGRDAGLRTALVLVAQPVTREVQRTLELLAVSGAELRYGGGVPGAALEVVRAFAAATLRGERPAYVPTGGSSTRGNLGLVSAAFELAEQVRAGVLPEPALLYVAVGSGGTHAGLVAGLALAGLRTRVVGVLATDILPPSTRRLTRMARAALYELARALPGLRTPPVGEHDFDFVRSQLGPGYGAATVAAREAVAAAAARGLEIETTYTGKCLAALIERARSGGGLPGPVLFWNTFNAVAQGDPDPDAAARALPPVLRRFVAQAPLD